MVAQNSLALSDEQRELRDTVRKMLADKAPLSGLRERADAGGGFDESLWHGIGELGLVALTIPEKYDGLGQSALETNVVFEEMGRALYHGPYLATVGLAVPALLAVDDASARAELLPAIAGGAPATLAVIEAAGGWSTSATTTRATPDTDGWRLTGTKAVVLDGARAQLLLVTARTAQGVGLYAVHDGADGLRRTELESLDPARSLARIDLADTPARRVGGPDAAAELVRLALDHALVGLAAEQAGGMAACLQLCTGYATTRRQFGHPIGSYQAIAHKLVDMLHRAEFGRAAARYAAAALAEGAADAAEAAQVAAAYCAEGFRWVTAETVQAHGGIGFTWEHDAHLYYRRAWSAGHLFGGTDQHYLALADRLGL
jgi:alkylation response protein AidB-like acyl-CoA dehydrogenase